MKYLLPVLLLTTHLLSAEAQTDISRLRLEKAKEYFVSEKYHESLNEFLKLDEEYNLSTHYYAYMGLCFYKENAYEKACTYYEKAKKYIEVCAPGERSLYLYTLGESYFKLQRYAEARTCYEKMLDVCREEEKADAYYHIGFCQYFTGEKIGALHSFRISLKNYKKYPHATGTAARMSQLHMMAVGLENELNNKTTDNGKKH